MSGAKQAWWQAIDDDLPQAISELLDVTFDTKDVTAPSTVDAAIIAQGLLAKKVNKILDDLDGLSIVELALRIGQRSTTAKLMLLAGVEALSDVEDEGFLILEPEDGREYQPGEIPARVKVNSDEITEIAVATDDGDAITLRGSVWSGTLLPIPGERIATFTSDTGLVKSVSFYIPEFTLETYPAEGDIVPGPVLELRAIPSVPETVETITADMTGGGWLSPVRFVLSAEEKIWRFLVDATPILRENETNRDLIEIPVQFTFIVQDTIADVQEIVVNSIIDLGMSLGELIGDALPGGD